MGTYAALGSTGYHSTLCPDGDIYIMHVQNTWHFYDSADNASNVCTQAERHVRTDKDGRKK